MKKAKSRVTSIEVSRLFNLGNYQNVSYRVAVEVAPGDSANKLLYRLASIMGALKPIKKPSCWEQHFDALKKPEEERSEWEKANMDQWVSEVSEYAQKRVDQDQAVKSLDSLGGTSKRKDAKDSWHDDDEPYF